MSQAVEPGQAPKKAPDAAMPKRARHMNAIRIKRAKCGDLPVCPQSYIWNGLANLFFASLRRYTCPETLAGPVELGTSSASNVFMPGLDGLETMRLIHRRRPTIPVIVISGRPLTAELTSEPDFLAMATRLGAIRSLPKPYKPEDLLATVEGCVAVARQDSPPLARDRDVASGR